MEKIEICKDVTAISNGIEQAETVQEKTDNFYQYLTGLGYSVTVQEIGNIYSNMYGNGYLRNADFEGIAVLFLKDMIAKKNANNIQSLGFTTNKTELYKLIEVSETEKQGIVELISTFKEDETRYFPYLELVELSDSIELVSNYQTLIAESLTVYSNNDKQIEATELLQTVATSLNALHGFLNIGSQDVAGLVFTGGTFKIDPKFVQGIK